MYLADKVNFICCVHFYTTVFLNRTKQWNTLRNESNCSVLFILTMNTRTTSKNYVLDNKAKKTKIIFFIQVEV